MAIDTSRREFFQAAGLAAGLMAAAAPVAAAAQPAGGARSMGARFRALMNAPEPLICANAYDTMSARLIEVHGFKGVFLGSSAANQEIVALPDQAVVTVSELVNYAINVASNINIPMVADL